MGTIGVVALPAWATQVGAAPPIPPAVLHTPVIAGAAPTLAAHPGVTLLSFYAKTGIRHKGHSGSYQCCHTAGGTAPRCGNTVATGVGFVHGNVLGILNHPLAGSGIHGPAGAGQTIVPRFVRLANMNLCWMHNSAENRMLLQLQWRVAIKRGWAGGDPTAAYL